MNVERFKLVRQHVADNPQFDMDISYNASWGAARVVGNIHVELGVVGNVLG